MSERLKEKIGDELYNKILEKGIKGNEIDLLQGFIPKSRFDEVNDKLKNANGQVDTLNNKLKDAEKLAGDNEEWKTKYSDLNTKYDNDIKAKDLENTNITKRYKVEARLIKEGAKHPDLLMGKIDLGKLSIEGDNILGMDDVIKSVKADYSDMFVETKIKNKTKSTNNKPDIDDDNLDEDGVDWGAIGSKL